MSHELYKRYRPTKLEDVLGQDDAVIQLSNWLKKGSMPHAVLFSGSSGCGKTTMARIAARHLLEQPEGKILRKNPDFESVNAAEARGIDKIRDIQMRMSMYPLGGKCRIWILDECHRLTGDSQSALLETLEDTPDHVYFMLCTTDPQKLLLAIRTRCSHLTLSQLSRKLLKNMAMFVSAKEKIKIDPETVDLLAATADGSARKVLVLLGQIAGLPPDEQRRIIDKADTKKTAYQLAKALIWGRAKWPEIAGIIEAIEDTDWEGMRQLVMACASKELLSERNGKPSGKAFLILEVFRESWFYTGRNGLVWACCEVFRQKD